MKKQLRVLYRYFIASRRWRRWINRQNALIVLLSAAFLYALSWTGPLPPAERQDPRDVHAAGIVLPQDEAPEAAQATPLPDDAATGAPVGTPTPTPFPPEFYTNADQTVGITLAGAVLVLIVIFGVLKFQPGKPQQN